jgi:hypothetical protein
MQAHLATDYRDCTDLVSRRGILAAVIKGISNVRHFVENICVVHKQIYVS